MLSSMMFPRDFISNDDAAATARGIMDHNYLHLFAISFFYYDHFITIGRASDTISARHTLIKHPVGQEVEYLWKRQKKQSSYWFFANRYIPFFTNLAITILGFINLTPEVLVSVLLTLRIYALYGCSVRILTFMVGSGMILIGISCWTLFGQQNPHSSEGVVGGCHIGMARETAFRIAGAWEALFVYDSIIFTLTILKTWKARREHRITGVTIPLISLILRDGAIYFAVMALCNFANILTFYFGGTFLRGGLSTFSSAISVTMMTRLMLNLHETADEGIFTTRATNTTMDYASRVGASIDFGSASASRRQSRALEPNSDFDVQDTENTGIASQVRV
ncbi:hypothetical protein D9613_008214 [Agrocybe pediades]|uniref:Transmembrane protein n=1 Tax=Agrocybe pediades TaxID=84607 RepID=A0A8H4QT33_9AGAR|nr:hypothetical protein D9613_008214 [Agrocybe pediades]